VVLDKQGALLVADDAGNVIWRVTAPGGSRTLGRQGGAKDEHD